MKESLIEILGLDAAATDEQVIGAVAELKATAADLKKEADAKALTNAREKKIQKKITESGGALNREQAAMAIDHQEEAEANRKAKAKK